MPAGIRHIKVDGASAPGKQRRSRMVLLRFDLSTPSQTQARYLRYLAFSLAGRPCQEEAKAGDFAYEFSADEPRFSRPGDSLNSRILERLSSRVFEFLSARVPLFLLPTHGVRHNLLPL